MVPLELAVIWLTVAPHVGRHVVIASQNIHLAGRLTRLLLRADGTAHLTLDTGAHLDLPAHHHGGHSA